MTHFLFAKNGSMFAEKRLLHKQPEKQQAANEILDQLKKQAEGIPEAGPRAMVGKRVDDIRKIMNGQEVSNAKNSIRKDPAMRRGMEYLSGSRNVGALADYLPKYHIDQAGGIQVHETPYGIEHFPQFKPGVRRERIDKEKGRIGFVLDANYQWQLEGVLQDPRQMRAQTVEMQEKYAAGVAKKNRESMIKSVYLHKGMNGQPIPTRGDMEADFAKDEYLNAMARGDTPIDPNYNPQWTDTYKVVGQMKNSPAEVAARKRNADKAAQAIHDSWDRNVMPFLSPSARLAMRTKPRTDKELKELVDNIKFLDSARKNPAAQNNWVRFEEGLGEKKVPFIYRINARNVLELAVNTTGKEEDLQKFYFHEKKGEWIKTDDEVAGPPAEAEPVAVSSVQNVPNGPSAFEPRTPGVGARSASSAPAVAKNIPAATKTESAKEVELTRVRLEIDTIMKGMKQSEVARTFTIAGCKPQLERLTVLQNTLIKEGQPVMDMGAISGDLTDFGQNKRVTFIYDSTKKEVVSKEVAAPTAPPAIVQKPEITTKSVPFKIDPPDTLPSVAAPSATPPAPENTPEKAQAVITNHLAKLGALYETSIVAVTNRPMVLEDLMPALSKALEGLTPDERTLLKSVKIQLTDNYSMYEYEKLMREGILYVSTEETGANAEFVLKDQLITGLAQYKKMNEKPKIMPRDMGPSAPKEGAPEAVKGVPKPNIKNLFEGHPTVFEETAARSAQEGGIRDITEKGVTAFEESVKNNGLLITEQEFNDLLKAYQTAPESEKGIRARFLKVIRDERLRRINEETPVSTPAGAPAKNPNAAAATLAEGGEGKKTLNELIADLSKETGIADISVDDFIDNPVVKKNFANVKTVFSSLDDKTKKALVGKKIGLGDTSYQSERYLILNVASSVEEMTKYISTYMDNLKLYAEMQVSIATLGQKINHPKIQIDDFEDARVVKDNFTKVETLLTDLDQPTKDILAEKTIDLGNEFFSGESRFGLDTRSDVAGMKSYILKYVDLLKS